MGKSLTFGRWEKAAGNENAGTGATEGPGRLRTFGRWEETREIRTPSEGGKGRMETKTRAQVLQRVPGDCAPSEGEQKCGKSAHLRKVGRGGWKRKRGHRCFGGPRTDCAPSEGEQKTWEFRTPSEGGRRPLETETRAQTLQRVPGDYAPSEGGKVTREY